MPKTLRQLRSKPLRLLASLLVMMAILCNGIGLAQAQSAMAKKDCCAEMTGHKKTASPCCEETKSPHTSCDDQCMARCMGSNGILAVPFAISQSVLITTPLPQFNVTEHSLADLGPGLRPPIHS